MKDIIILLGILALLVVIWEGSKALTSYDERVAEYNRHMCVDVYGKDEQCL